MAINKLRYWHPGRLRRGVMIIGKPFSEERIIASQPLVDLIKENTNITKEESEILINKYLQIK